MKAMKIFSILIFTLALNLNISAQTGVARAEALFIYNFSRLIEWPANYKNGPFVIGVLGNHDIFTELQTYTNGKSVGSQPIVVKMFSSPGAIGACHSLFVPFPESKHLPTIIPNLQGKSTLLITEKNGSIQDGAGINFVVIGDKLKFEFGPANVAKHNIKVSSKLSEMAYKVY